MSPSAPSGSGTESSSSDLRPITVMIVDDQRATRMGLSLIINRADDLRVTAQAAHGQDALDQLAALLQERRTLPDVVLMDVRMPVLNGIDATARICQLYPSIRVLVLTTYDEDDYAFGALEVGPRVSCSRTCARRSWLRRCGRWRRAMPCSHRA